MAVAVTVAVAVIVTVAVPEAVVETVTGAVVESEAVLVSVGGIEGGAEDRHPAVQESR